MVLAPDALCLPFQIDAAPLVELGQVAPYRAGFPEHMLAFAFQEEGRGGHIYKHRSGLASNVWYRVLTGDSGPVPTMRRD